MPGTRMLLIAALSACNQVYGLDSTTIREVGIDAPPDLEDEDLDTVPNDLDNCPGVSNSTQSDGDGDGVGDICDRFPQIATERIAGRFMFNRPALDASEWSGSGWDFRDGFVIQPTVGASASMFMQRTFEGATLIVETRINPIQVERSDAGNKIGVVLEGLGGDECFVTSSATGEGLYVATNSGNVTNGSPPIDDNVPFQLRAMSLRTRSDMTMDPLTHCQIGSVAQQLQTSVKLPGPVGLLTRLDAARIDYVVVYASESP